MIVNTIFLVEEEGALSSFRGIGEMIDKYGLFCEFYTDRGSHYFHTPKPGEPVSRGVRIRVSRALASSVFAVSWAVRPRRAAVPSAPSEPFRTACPRNWLWPVSLRSRRSSARAGDV
jgi:hypothetical protein